MQLYGRMKGNFAGVTNPFGANPFAFGAVSKPDFPPPGVWAISPGPVSADDFLNVYEQMAQSGNYPGAREWHDYWAENQTDLLQAWHDYQSGLLTYTNQPPTPPPPTSPPPVTMTLAQRIAAIRADKTLTLAQKNKMIIAAIRERNQALLLAQKVKQQQQQQQQQQEQQQEQYTEPPGPDIEVPPPPGVDTIIIAPPPGTKVVNNPTNPDEQLVVDIQTNKVVGVVDPNTGNIVSYQAAGFSIPWYVWLGVAAAGAMFLFRGKGIPGREGARRRSYR